MLNAKIAVGGALVGAFILGAVVVGFSSAQPERADAPFSERQQEEIGEIVREYLMANPEVIIEAVNAFSERERMAEEERIRLSARSNLERLLDPQTAYIAGKNPEAAKVAVVELFDYHCGFCKRAAGLMQEMAKNDEDVKVVFRELPILREESEYAAEMALAARDQGKFMEMHFAMMEAPGVLTKERIHAMAREHGLDVEQMEKAVQEDVAISAAIADNHALAQEMGVTGTPAFIIASLNGEYVEIVNGFRAEDVRRKIEEAKKAAG